MKKKMRHVVAFFVFAALFAGVQAIPACNDFFRVVKSPETFVVLSMTWEARVNAIRFNCVHDECFEKEHTSFLVVTGTVATNAGPLAKGAVLLQPRTTGMTKYFARAENNAVKYYCEGVFADTLRAEVIKATLELKGDSLTDDFVKVSSSKQNAFAFDSDNATSNSFYVLAEMGESGERPKSYYKSAKGFFVKSNATGVKYLGCCTPFCEVSDGDCESSVLTASDYCLDNNTLVTHSCGENSCLPEQQECVFGCGEGVCKQGIAYCDDSDGLNTSVKGVISGVEAGDQKFVETDSCLSERVLKEWYCSSGLKASKTIECDCFDGACLTAVKATPAVEVYATPWVDVTTGKPKPSANGYFLLLLFALVAVAGVWVYFTEAKKLGKKKPETTKSGKKG